MPTLADCPRCRSPLEQGDLRCSICGQAAPRAPLERRSPSVVALRCSECGASVSYDASARAPRCAFCAAVMEIETVVDPLEQTQRFLPFTLDGEAAGDGLARWLGTLGFFRPSDLRSRARLETLRPLWWVAWVFDADALVSWTADSNHGSLRSAWAPHAGQVELVFDDILVSASRGLTEAETSALARSYDLASAGDEPAPALPDAVIERFDVQRSQARRRILDAVQRLAVARVEQHHVPGSRARNVHAAARLRGLVTQRFAFPAWVLAYRYRERLFRVVVSGQDARCVVGAAPYSALRIALVAAAVALVVLVAVLALAAGR